MVAASGAVLADNEVISYGKPGFQGLVREPFIFFVACLSSIGGLLFGYDQGVISGVLVMHSFVEKFPVLASDVTLQGWMVAVLTLGAMFGALANGPIADRISRRWSILLANIIFLIGSVIQAAAVNVPMIFVGRFIAGLSIGQLSMVVPLYLGELAPSNLRGSLIALQQLGITIGVMIAFWIDYGTQHIGGTGEGQSPAAWRLPLSLQCVPSIVLIIGTFFLPYSPRWLLMNDREEEARATLIRIRRVPETDHRIHLEVMEIKAASVFDQRTATELYPGVTSRFKLTIERYKSLLLVHHLSRRLLIACLLQFLQQFTGINSIIYYAPQIFQKIGLSGKSVELLATGVVGIINFLSTIPAVLFMDRWGRKKVLIIGGTGMSISHLIVATLYAVYKDSWSDHKVEGWVAVSFIWIFICSFAFSIGCVGWILPAEIFPPAVRSQAVGMAIGTNWLSNFVVALITPPMLRSIEFGTFYFFFGFCLFLIIWVVIWVPETKGVRMEEMDKLFGGHQGEQDKLRMDAIRSELGLISSIRHDLTKLRSGECKVNEVELSGAE